jgi:hypothetical protein
VHPRTYPRSLVLSFSGLVLWWLTEKRPSRTCPRDLISSSFPCVISRREERGRVGDKSDSTGSTTSAGPRTHTRTHTRTRTGHSRFSCAHTGSGFQISFVDLRCMLLVQLRKTPQMSQTHSQRGPLVGHSVQKHGGKILVKNMAVRFWGRLNVHTFNCHHRADRRVKGWF